MPKYIIERSMPGVGKLTSAQLRGASQTSCRVLNQLGPTIRWLQSYVSDDKIHCVYIAPNAALVREHAKQAGFPADDVYEVRAVIDPTTAELREGDRTE